jgi:alpha-ketoglutarate-dependent taurine dioxygenase
MTNGSSIDRLGTSSASLVLNSKGAPLSTVDRGTVLELLRTAGAILFRGFEVDLERFSAFVDAVSSKTTFDPGREFFTNNAQLVNVGNEAIDLHCENGNGPWRPDLSWFYCQLAASEGGRTTICDGARLWNELSEPTQNLFSTKKIKYCRTYASAKWKKFAASLLPHGTSPSDVTIRHVELILRQIPAISYRILDDESIYAEYSCFAVNRSKLSGLDSFANSMRGPYGGQSICMEDDSPVPASVEEDVTRTSARLIEELPWQDGDVVVIDNTRFMHGRTAFRDPHRRIFVALSYI